MDSGNNTSNYSITFRIDFVKPKGEGGKEEKSSKEKNKKGTGNPGAFYF